MTTTTAWAHLPNAKHIDAVLADVKARPEVWAAAGPAAWAAVRPAAWAAAGDAVRDAVRDAAWDAAWDAARRAARDAARDAALDAVWDAAWGPVVALIAWDSAADLLDLSADALRTLIVTAPEPVKYQAALLLPWAIVRETT